MFAVIALLFFLPFVTCGGVKVSGVQAATGLTPPGSDPVPSDVRDQVLVPDPFALVSFACAIAGIALVALRRRWGPFASALAAIVGVLGLSGFTVLAGAEAHGELGVEVGLSLSLGGFLLAAALNGLILARIPHRASGDERALAGQAARARTWFIGLGVAIMLILVVAASKTHADDPEDIVPFFVALVPLGVLALLTLVFVVRGFRRAGALSSER